MYSKLPIEVLLDQMSTKRVIALFKEGIENESEIQALSAMEVLIERRSTANVEQIVLENLKNDRISPLGTFGIALSNALLKSNAPSLRTIGRLLSKTEVDSGASVANEFASNGTLESDR